jgi:hypothetical protein
MRAGDVCTRAFFAPLNSRALCRLIMRARAIKKRKKTLDLCIRYDVRGGSLLR